MAIHIINPTKLKNTLAKSFTHFKIPIGEAEKKLSQDTNSFIFTFKETNVSLSFHNQKPSQVVLTNLDGKVRFTIVFDNITKVKYLPKLKTLVLESKQKTCFSQFWINSEGNFKLQSMADIKNYKYSWSNVMGN